eukprot:s1353_g11.t1
MQERKCRTYLQCQELSGVNFRPILIPQILSAGRYLMHAENGASPHCVAVQISDAAEVRDRCKVTVWDVDGVYRLTLGALMDALAQGVDSSTCVLYATLNTSEAEEEEEEQQSSVALTKDDCTELLGLAAGAQAGLSEQRPNEEAGTHDILAESDTDESSQRTADMVVIPSDSEVEQEDCSRFSSAFKWLDTAGRVTVEEHLLNAMATEIAAYIVAAKSGRSKMRQGNFPCTNFCCSGTKQLRLILSLHDSDMLQERPGKAYLHRSAAILRASVKPGLCHTNNKIDGDIRLLLDATGPSFKHKAVVETQLYVRRVKTVWPRFMLDSVKAGNELTNLLPTHTSSWWPLVEDVFRSPPVMNLTKDLVEEAIKHNECEYISIDGTFRVCFSLLGQSRFDAPATEKDLALSGDAEAVHRVISIRGRSGAVLGLLPAKDESAEELLRCLQDVLPANALGQIQHIATDAPSRKLHSHFANVLPQFQGLSLDPTHAAMRYEQGTFGRKTSGSVLLRSFMEKFTARATATGGNLWGPIFQGDTRALSPQESRLREQILTQGMSLRRAGNVIRDAAILQVWPTRIQFIEALAALAAKHPEDMNRKIDGVKITVAKTLHALASADKLEWLFNALRYRASLSGNVRLLLPSGTTSNEALHAEINAWFRQIQSMHRSTLCLKLQILRLGKLLSHSVALHHPTLRQMPPAQVLARRLGTAVFTDQQWKDWVVLQRNTGNTSRSKLPLAARKPVERQQGVLQKMKRPAAQKRKRTPFTLERSKVRIPRARLCRRPAARQKA